MQITIEVLRRENAESAPHWERFSCEADSSATVMTALIDRNAQLAAEGKPVIAYECSCLQKKCGACAMVVNGRPCLACDAKLLDVQKKGVILVEPLRKFPVIADLIVDRHILYENLKALHIWLESECIADGKQAELAYEASRCLQCGCCLEVCPNFYAGGKFFGMAGMAPAARLIAEAPEDDKKRLYGSYNEHFYRGCGKSLACRDICPAQLPIEELLVRSNAACVWKRWKTAGSFTSVGD